MGSFFSGAKSATALTVLLLSFNTLLAQEQNTGSDYFIEAVRELNEGNAEKAVGLFKESLLLDPDNEAAFYYLGQISESCDETELAEGYYKKACEADPQNFWYRISLARFYSQHNQMELALSLYEGISKDFPKKGSVYYELIDIYTNTGQIDKALETLDKIESLRGINEATGNARYQLLIMQKKYDEASAYLEIFNRDFPSPQASCILGDIHKSKFEDTTAVIFYSQAIALDPQYAPAYLGMAEINRTSRQFPQFFKNINVFLSSPNMAPAVKADYLTEVILNPQFVQAFKPQVDTMIANTLMTHPSDSSILLMAGSYYVQTDEKEKGKELYKRNMELYPNVMKANIEYISLLYYLQEWGTLIPQLKNSMAYFPGDISLMELLAVSYWQSNDIDNAILTYMEMIKALPKGDGMMVNCYTALGDLYQLKSNSKKALSYYEKGYKISPDYIPLLNNYAYYLSQLRKDLKKAVALSKKTVKAEPDNPTYLDTYGWLLYLTGELEDAKDCFKHAMVYGAKDNAVIVDHYADVLFALKEYDLAFIYWDQADKMDPSLGIALKKAQKKSEIGR